MSRIAKLLRVAVALVLLIAVTAGSLIAQSATTQKPRNRAHRIFAAQTGPDQVTLVWDEVPGATEYRIYLADPNAPGRPSLNSRPTMTLSGSGRQARVQGVQRLANGAYLVALRAGQVLYEGTFNPVSRAALAPISAPDAVLATETGAAEVTITWSPVPGATAYAIGRRVSPDGLRPACPLCPPVTEYVDTTAIPGREHFYTVQAIFPMGVSGRTASARLVVGAGLPVAATPGTPAPPAPTTGAPPAPAPEAAPPAPMTGTPPDAPQPGTDSVPARINPEIPATVPDTAPPSLGPAPVGAESLVTPADTGTCVTAAPAQTDTIERIDRRADGIDLRTTTNPDAAVTAAGSLAFTTTTKLGSAEYRQGRCLNRAATGHPALWDAVAAASGMTSAEQVAAWKEISIVALEYRHILGRQPTPEETRRHVAALRAGTTWQQLWRQLAHSAERDTRFGYWAPAPIPDARQAQVDFGLAEPPWTPQQCFGGVGPRCGGGIPQLINGKIQPYWFGAFRMPDNTELAYVEIGVAVGSILHDNACLKYKDGLNCNGLGAGGLIATGVYPAGFEWNKASWNVIDQRTWRATFGPYPTDPRIRDSEWYDDLRPMPARPTMMAPAISATRGETLNAETNQVYALAMVTWPGLTLKYAGGETRQSRALLAPPGTSLDDTDRAFCQSGAFSSTGWFIGKASWGICR